MKSKSDILAFEVRAVNRSRCYDAAREVAAQFFGHQDRLHVRLLAADVEQAVNMPDGSIQVLLYCAQFEAWELP